VLVVLVCFWEWTNTQPIVMYTCTSVYAAFQPSTAKQSGPAPKSSLNHPGSRYMQQKEGECDF